MKITKINKKANKSKIIIIIKNNTKGHMQLINIKQKKIKIKKKNKKPVA
jgi:hypothetical protein